MNHAVKNLLRVAGVLAGLGAAAWALRDQMLPPPEIHDEPPPMFRTGGGADDLTQIKGVGPVYRERLAEAGTIASQISAIAWPRKSPRSRVHPLQSHKAG